MNKNRIYTTAKAKSEVKVKIISQKTNNKIFKEVNQQLKKVIVLLCEIIFSINIKKKLRKNNAKLSVKKMKKKSIIGRKEKYKFLN